MREMRLHFGKRIAGQAGAVSPGTAACKGAARGAREFDERHDRIVIGRPRTTVASRTVIGPALELIATVRNDTGRVIKGLEARGTVVDTEGRKVNERVAVIIQTRQTAIKLNEEINARLLLKTARAEAAHAVFRVEVMWLIFD